MCGAADLRDRHLHGLDRHVLGEPESVAEPCFLIFFPPAGKEVRASAPFRLVLVTNKPVVRAVVQVAVRCARNHDQAPRARERGMGAKHPKLGRTLPAALPNREYVVKNSINPPFIAIRPPVALSVFYADAR